MRPLFGNPVRRVTRLWTWLVLAFLYAPLLLVVINAFNRSKSFAFPPSGFTLAWWKAAALWSEAAAMFRRCWASRSRAGMASLREPSRSLSASMAVAA